MACKFNIICVDKLYEGILCLKLTHKISLNEFLICTCYLPPEGSERGQDSDDFFNHLLNVVYRNIDCDLILFCGDLNARIGSNSDIIENIDLVKSRKVLDLSKNKHGDVFLEFLKESKMCILNGRFDAFSDNYTSVSTKGKAVVDYFFTLQSMLDKVKSFRVLTVKEICDSYNLRPLCKIPDHSILLCSITMSDLQISNSKQNVNSCDDPLKKRETPIALS